MKWYDNLYVGDSIVLKVDKIKRKIKRNKKMAAIYVIALASNPDNLLDIIPEKELVRRGYPREGLRIVGIADGYEDALQIVHKIIDDTYRSNGNVDVYTYLKEHQRSKS